MNTDALFWIGVIMFSPSFFVLGKFLTRLLWDTFVPDDRITLSYTDREGKKHSKVVYLEHGSDLQRVLSEIREDQKKHGRGI